MLKLQSLVCIWSLLLIFNLVAAPAGKIITVEGDVFVSHKLKKRKAAVGESVYAKDKIKTKAASKIVIDTGSSKITLEENSYLKLPKASKGKDSKTKLALYGGGVKFKVNKLSSQQQFTIKTPSAVAGVRGTVGEVNYSNGVTGCQAMSGGDHKSTIWTAPPGYENKLNEAISQDRSNEEQGKQSAEPPQGVTVVNEGQASFTMPDGSAVLVNVKPGSTLKTMVNQVVTNIQNNAGGQALQSRQAEFLENLSEGEERLLNLIRIININTLEEQRRTELPGPPVLPSND